MRKDQIRFENFFLALLLIFTTITSYAQNQYVQIGGKLVGTNYGGFPRQGCAVAISQDGKTAIVGGNTDNYIYGSAWIYTFNGNNFVQYGDRLTDLSVYSKNANWGSSVSLSADGHIALVGGPNYSTGLGFVLVYSLTGNSFTQVDGLLGPGLIGLSHFGSAVSISADANIALVGGPGDDSDNGAAWIYSYTGSYFQTKNKLLASDAQGASRLGSSVCLSADGKTAVVGGTNDNSNKGAVWVYTFDGTNYVQFGNKLTAPVATASSKQGTSVSISADGKTILVGGYYNDDGFEAAWIYTFNGTNFVQAGDKLVGSDVTSGFIQQGIAVSLSADGKTVLFGSWGDNLGQGAGWVYTFNGSSFVQVGHKIVGSGSEVVGNQAYSVSLSGDGKLALIGGAGDNENIGATWLFGDPARILSITKIEAFPDFCIGKSAMISVTAVGISLEYQWYKNNAPLVNETAAGLALTNLNPAFNGNYFCVVSNVIGSRTSSGINVFVKPTPTVTGFISPQLVCIGDLVTITGTGAPYFAISGDLHPGVGFVPTISGTYTLTGFDNGCTDMAILNVTVVNVIITISGNRQACTGSSTVLTASGADTYQWSTGSRSSVAEVFPVSATTYQVTGTGMNGCFTKETVLITVSSLPTVSLDLLSLNQLCNTVGSVALNGGTPGGGTYFYSGSSANVLDISKGGAYPIIYQYTDKKTCINTAFDTLDVKICLTICELPDPPCSCTNTCPPPFKIYNAITPNNDQLNDYWVVDSLIGDYKLTILDKWGNEVYHIEPYLNNWDGRGSRNQTLSGIYYYILEAVNEKRRYTGTVSVIR